MSAVADEAPIMIQTLAVGTRIKLAGGDIMEITANPRDGSWLFARNMTTGAEDEMVFARDVVEVIENG